jgi:N-acetylneuraminate synthase
MIEFVTIGNRRVGPGYPCFMVAEISANHNRDLDRALETIRAAADAGADAVKIQTYTPATMTLNIDRGEFVVPGDGPWGGRTLWDLYSEAHTPWEWHESLFEAARSAGIEIFSTPFDSTAVDLLEALGAPAFKIASFELVDDALLRRVAETGKPVILSTGMASLEETAHAVDTLRSAGADELVVLHCTSAYPAPDSEMNLRTIETLQATLQCPVGLSDHSRGTVAPLVAVSMGACLVEKHFTLSRSDGGVDSHFSIEPEELGQLVTEVRRAEEMMGTATFGPGLAERDAIVFRRSLYVVADMDAGEQFTTENVRSIRPGFGLAPRHLAAILGKRVQRPVERGTAVTWDLLGSGG